MLIISDVDIIFDISNDVDNSVDDNDEHFDNDIGVLSF